MSDGRWTRSEPGYDTHTAGVTRLSPPFMALLSLLVTGLGTMLTGHVARGLCFLAAVIGGAVVGLGLSFLSVPIVSRAADSGSDATVAAATAFALLPMALVVGVHLWGVVDAYRTAVAHNRDLGAA